MKKCSCIFCKTMTMSNFLKNVPVFPVKRLLYHHIQKLSIKFAGMVNNNFFNFPVQQGPNSALIILEKFLYFLKNIPVFLKMACGRPE